MNYRNSKNTIKQASLVLITGDHAQELDKGDFALMAWKKKKLIEANRYSADRLQVRTAGAVKVKAVIDEHVKKHKKKCPRCKGLKFIASWNGRTAFACGDCKGTGYIKE